MTDVKIEAVAWAVVSPGGLIRCTYNEPPDELRILSAESSGDTIEPRYPESTITALQERIAELTNANLRMLGERDRARIAEGEVARARIWADWLERQDDSAEFDPVGLARTLRKALAGES